MDPATRFPHLSRRELMAALSGLATSARGADGSHQASGVKAGEITPDSAVIWTRRTATVRRLDEGIRRRGHTPKAWKLKPGEDVNLFEGACPGAAGEMRVSIEPVSGRGKRQTLAWAEARPESGYAHQFRVQGLTADTEYRYSVETRGSRSGAVEPAVTGKLRTAPAAQSASPVEFALLSCQMFHRMDTATGFSVYSSIEKWNPNFLLGCGDNVYYDSEDPIVDSPTVARYHWERMFSLPKLESCLRNVPGYWQKDDHDYWDNDAFPGKAMSKIKTAPFTEEEGKRIFRQQVPAPTTDQPLYRRFRWGSDVEIWLPEARDYRDANDAPDGPGKSLWGARQKKWIQETLLGSDARWKIMINPNPIVGPDHGQKRDNHANPAFATEGREFRQWLKDNVAGRVIVMNGDRHWQYHSIDPETGLHEFGCGPASDEHAVPPSGGEDKRYHRFLRIKGGFVAVKVDPGSRGEHLVIEHRDMMGTTVNRVVYPRPA
ncbi:MAG: alkaline phosphatase D family protein [Bryobacteraceae bacterium]